MRLHSLRLENFKGVSEREVEFPESGVVVISGANEIGKTSMIDAFDMLIELPHTSRHARVRAAQPVGQDVGVTVEAELTIHDERVRVSRTWLKKPSTQLRFISGRRRGQQLAGDAACDALTALWQGTDATLWGALRLMQATNLKQQGLIGSQSLKKALEAAAGGQDLTEDTGGLVALATAEANLYFTASNKTPKGDYKQALDALAAARDRHAKARAGLETLQDCQARLQRAVAEAERQQLLLQTAEADLQEAGSERAKVDAAIATAQAAQSALNAAEYAEERARRALEARTQAAREVAEAEAAVDEVEARLAAERELLAPIEGDVARVKGELSEAEDALNLAECAREAALAAQQRLAAEAALAKVAAQVEQLDDLRVRIGQLEQDVDHRITADLVEQIAQAELDVITGEKVLAASSAQLTITALEAERTLVLGSEQVELPTGASWQCAVTDPVAVELPGQLRVEIAPARVAGLGDELDAARRRLADLLAQSGAGSAAEARRRLAESGHAAAELKAAKGQRDILLAGRSEADLLDERARLTQLCATPFDGDLPQDAAEADRRVQESGAARGRANELVSELRAQSQGLRQQREERAGKVTELSSRHTLLAEQAAAAGLALAQDRAACTDEALAEAATRGAVDLTTAQEQVAACLDELEELQADRVVAAFEDVSARVEDLRQLINDNRENECTLTGELNGLNAVAVQQEFDAAQTALEVADQRAESITRRANAALRLEQTLLAHQDAAQRNYLEPFRAAVAELGAKAYSDRDFDVRVEPDLTVSARYLEGTWIEFDALSTGAREQLLIMIRMATARLVNPVDRVPVLLDDALGYTDTPRLGRMLRALEGGGQDTQVIVLTANPERYVGLGGRSRVDL